MSILFTFPCSYHPPSMLGRCPHLCFDQHFWMWQLPGTFSVFTPPFPYSAPCNVPAFFLDSPKSLELRTFAHLSLGLGRGCFVLWAGDTFKNQLRQPEFFLWDLCQSWLDQLWCLITGKWLTCILSHSSFWLKIIFLKLKYKMNTVLILRWHLQLLFHHHYFTLSSLRDQIVKC